MQVIAAEEAGALAQAVAALETTSGYVVDGRASPAPSDVCGAPLVETHRFSLLGLQAD